LNQSVSLDGPAPEGAGIPPGTTLTSLDGALLRVAAAPASRALRHALEGVTARLGVRTH